MCTNTQIVNAIFKKYFHRTETVVSIVSNLETRERNTPEYIRRLDANLGQTAEKN